MIIVSANITNDNVPTKNDNGKYVKYIKKKTGSRQLRVIMHVVLRRTI